MSSSIRSGAAVSGGQRPTSSVTGWTQDERGVSQRCDTRSDQCTANGCDASEFCNFGTTGALSDRLLCEELR